MSVEEGKEKKPKTIGCYLQIVHARHLRQKKIKKKKRLIAINRNEKSKRGIESNRPKGTGGNLRN